MPWTLRMTFYLALLGAPFEFYVTKRVLNALTLVTGWPRTPMKVTAAVCIFYLVLYPVVMVGSYFLGIDRVYQHSGVVMDALLAYPFWIGIVLAFQLSLVLIFMDLMKLPLLPVYWKYRERWHSVQSWVVVVLVCVGLVFVVARVLHDTFGLRVRQTEYRVAGLPEDLDGLRIVQISDIHVDSRTNGRKLQNFIDRVNSLNADVILFGGDTVSTGTAYIQQAAEALGQLRSRYGTYAVMGDHDYFSNRELVASALQDNGVKVLEEASTAIPVGSTQIALTGVTNVYMRRASPVKIESLARSRPEAPFSIFLTHQPSPWIVDQAHREGYDLFVAGHTHGGQIAFPLPGFTLAGSRFETKYFTGFYRLNPMLVSVTNGLGETLAPVRYNAPAEVTLIVLRSDAGR